MPAFGALLVGGALLSGLVRRSLLRIFNIAALCVFVSILAHSVTDTPGSEWLAKRGERPAPAR